MFTLTVLFISYQSKSRFFQYHCFYVGMGKNAKTQMENVISFVITHYVFRILAEF